MKKALIFGANGQDGYYLDQLLRLQQVETILVSRSEGTLQVALDRFDEVAALIQQHLPDFIFHLAANSTTSHTAIFENHQTISTGTLNILEGVKQFSPHTKVFISGSGLQFENKGVPIRETDPFEARDIYSVCRIQSVYAARYFRTLGIKTYVGYFFNHDSPRRSERHMAMKIAAFAKKVHSGFTGTLEIGDIHTVKEWTYAGDVVKGIWTLVNQDEVVEANISSGLGYSIQDWLDACFEIAGTDWRTHVHIKEGFKAEYQQLVSNPALIQSLSWKPEISFKALAQMMMS